MILLFSLLHACRPTLLPRGPSREGSLVQPLAFEYLKLSATLSYQEGPHKCQRGSVRFRLKKDVCIWFSVTAPWGLEVIRGMITPEGLTVLNHMQQVYYAYDYAELRTRWPFPWDYALIQALLLGEMVQTHTSQEVLQTSPQQARVRQKPAHGVFTYLVNLATGQIQQVVITDTAQQHRWVGTYQPGKSYAGGVLFEQVQLDGYEDAFSEQPAVTLILEGLKASWPKKPLSFPFSIPQHYEKQ
ncbi:MAG: DUF4292 domain-containing protein [Roseivirga sp.]